MRFGGVLDEIAARLSPRLVPMTRVEGLGSRDAAVHPRVDLLRLADHDPVGVRDVAAHHPHFAPPSLESTVEPLRRADRGALHAALDELAEQDPLIDVRRDVRREVFVSLYGEVQKEVIQATLAERYGIEVAFRDTTTLCIERPAGVGEAAEFNKVGPNPFLATVGLRIEPRPPGAGVSFALGVELGSMPPAFFKAVEETVRETLGQGLHGWPVTDAAVTMTRAGYSRGRVTRTRSSTGACRVVRRAGAKEKP